MLPFAQFKKRKKHQWRSTTFSVFHIFYIEQTVTNCKTHHFSLSQILKCYLLQLKNMIQETIKKKRIYLFLGSRFAQMNCSSNVSRAFSSDVRIKLNNWAIPHWYLYPIWERTFRDISRTGYLTKSKINRTYSLHRVWIFIKTLFVKHISVSQFTFNENKSFYILLSCHENSISCHRSLSMPPENIKKALIFWCFQGV